MYCFKPTTVILLLLFLIYESNGKENEKSLFDKWSWNSIRNEVNKAINVAGNAINMVGTEIIKAIDITGDVINDAVHKIVESEAVNSAGNVINDAVHKIVESEAVNSAGNVINDAIHKIVESEAVNSAGNVINDAVHKIVESEVVNSAGNVINDAVHKIVDSAADIDLVKIYQKTIETADKLLTDFNNKVLKPGKDVTKKLAKATQDRINDIRKNFAETKCAQAVTDMRKESVRDCVQSIDIIDIGLSSCANFLTEGGPAGFFNDNVDQEAHTSDGVRCGALVANLVSPGVGSIIKNVHSVQNDVKKGQTSNSDVLNYAKSILDVIEPGLGKSIAGFANCYDLGDAEKIRHCSLTVVNTIGSNLVSKDRIDQINKFLNYFDVVVECASVTNESNDNDMQNITKCVRSIFKRFY